MSRLSRLLNANKATPSAPRAMEPIPTDQTDASITRNAMEQSQPTSNSASNTRNDLNTKVSKPKPALLESSNLEARLIRDAKKAEEAEAKAERVLAKRRYNKKIREATKKYLPARKHITAAEREEAKLLGTLDVEHAERIKNPEYARLIAEAKAEAVREEKDAKELQAKRDLQENARTEKDLEQMTLDGAKLAEFMDNAYDERLSHSQDNLSDLRAATLDGRVLCAKTGRFIYQIDATALEEYAVVTDTTDEAPLAFGALTQTIHPMWLSSAPEHIERLRYVDPAGMFVYLSSQLTGKKIKSHAHSFDKRQGETGFAGKLSQIKERGQAYEIVTEMLSETLSRRDILVCNEIMLRLLALTNFHSLGRDTWTALTMPFASPLDGAKNFEKFRVWIRKAFKLIAKKRLKGNDSDGAVYLKSRNANGNSSYAYVVTQKSRAIKRRQLNEIGFSQVITNTLIDAITEEELEIPSGEVLNINMDAKQKDRIHNRIIRKLNDGKDTAKTRGSRGVAARKRLAEELEVNDFLEGMGDL